MPTLAAIVPLRGEVLYPGMLRMMPVRRATSIKALEAHIEHDLPLVLVPQRDPEEEAALHADLAEVGVAVNLLRITRLPDGTLRALFEGTERVRLHTPLELIDGFTGAMADPLQTSAEDPVRIAASALEVGELFREYMTARGMARDEHDLVAADPDHPERLIDQAAALLNLTLIERIALLEVPDLDARLELCLSHLIVAVAQQQIKHEVSARVQQAMDDNQRQYQLREQLKAIREALGLTHTVEATADQFARRLAESGMPAEQQPAVAREIDRLRQIAADSPEYAMVRSWLEAACDMPWGKRGAVPLPLDQAAESLQRDHYGLDSIKDRVLEALAVRTLNPTSPGGILCLVGPPGVGKTSLGRAIANAMGRSYARIALGGVRDEHEIRGHRRTYVGAMPGRIVRALIAAGCEDPVIVLDELDKLGHDRSGDPSSALLEVLDPEQRQNFVDHYLDLPIDLSGVLFVATANVLSEIPEPLRDRLEILALPGYTEDEKLGIARHHLLPRLARNHGMTEAQAAIDERALGDIIRGYTREAGVRELETRLARILRKRARKLVEGESLSAMVEPGELTALLGPPLYRSELVERTGQVGVAVGLAWTAAGGDILFVEATRMPGEQGLKVTGSLGDVMRESAEAAFSWLRSHHDDFGLDPKTFEQAFHLHVPAGAIPKDGPSAGVTMATALASLVTGRVVHPNVAMTGEITLRGKVLPVGGLKEKVLAARRAGSTKVIVPRHNLARIEELPAHLTEGVEFLGVDTIKEVLDAALAD